MKLTDEEFMAANERAAATKGKYPTVVSVRYDRRVSRLVLTLASGLELGVPPKLIVALAHARQEDLAVVKLTPSGLGIHFPKLDADLYIPALLEDFLGSKRRMPKATTAHTLRPFTFRVTWSPEDGEHVGMCDEFPSLSWLSSSPESALKGIRRLVAEAVADMQAAGELVPVGADPKKSPPFEGRGKGR